MLIKLHRTTTFQLAILASVAFIGIGGAVNALSYWSMAYYIDARIDKALERESADLTAAFHNGGYEGLRQTIEGRASHHPDALRLYLLSAPGKELVGNLKSWPDLISPAAPRSEVRIPNDTNWARVRTLSFPGGVRVLAGRTLSERSDLWTVAKQSLLRVLTANLLLGLAGGSLLALYARRRLGQINATTQKVLDGDLSERIPVGIGGDEYDHLAQNINAMLDRIQVLVTTIRGVTENIAHDLRTPLNRLRGRMEVALMAPRASGEYREILKRAIADTEAMVGTFNGILKISRLRSGALDLPQASVDLAEVVEELMDLYSAFADESGVALEVDVHPSTGTGTTVRVTGDPHLISQAAANLLDNAIKYSPRGATVEISTRRTSEGVCLTIADRGPGIPASARTAIIDRYVRGENASSKAGFGLGLSFASAVAEWHGARLVLEDNAPGLRATLLFPNPPGQRAAP